MKVLRSYNVHDVRFDVVRRSLRLPGFAQRDRNDKWDQVVGACATGAFLNRGKGPSAMIQGASVYGMFSLVFSAMEKKDRLDVVDVPVEPLERRR